jgi:hypothetical protein
MSTNVLTYGDYVRESIEKIRVKRQGLDPSGALFQALNDDRIDAVVESLFGLPDDALDGGAWCPAIFGLAGTFSASELCEFDCDLTQVVSHTTTDFKNSQQYRSLVSGTQSWRNCYGPLFEVSIKGRLLRNKCNVDFDFQLPNGRDVDVRLSRGGRPFFLEFTALTLSQDDEDHWDEHFEAKKTDPDAVGFRPINVPKTLDRYYQKFFKKLAGGLNPDKHQQSIGNANIILLGFPNIDIRPTSPQTRAALEALFLGRARPLGYESCGLENFLKRQAASDFDLHSPAYDEFLSRLPASLDAPRRIGAVILFDQYEVSYDFINPHALPGHEVSQAELDEIKLLLCPLPLWCRRLMNGPE